MLREHDIDFVVLAGFLARVPDLILHAYPNKMINIHPSLLPKFGGKGMYGDRVHEAVIAAGEEESGITVGADASFVSAAYTTSFCKNVHASGVS